MGIAHKEDATMDSLMDAANRVWDVGKIKAMFSPTIASEILNIVLGLI